MKINALYDNILRTVHDVKNYKIYTFLKEIFLKVKSVYLIRFKS